MNRPVSEDSGADVAGLDGDICVERPLPLLFALVCRAFVAEGRLSLFYARFLQYKAIC